MKVHKKCSARRVCSRGNDGRAGLPEACYAASQTERLALHAFFCRTSPLTKPG
jgi:hypothetical protein